MAKHRRDLAAEFGSGDPQDCEIGKGLDAVGYGPVDVGEVVPNDKGFQGSEFGQVIRYVPDTGATRGGNNDAGDHAVDVESYAPPLAAVFLVVPVLEEGAAAKIALDDEKIVRLLAWLLIST